MTFESIASSWADTELSPGELGLQGFDLPLERAQISFGVLLRPSKRTSHVLPQGLPLPLAPCGDSALDSAVKDVGRVGTYGRYAPEASTTDVDGATMGCGAGGTLSDLGFVIRAGHYSTLRHLLQGQICVLLFSFFSNYNSLTGSL